MGASTTGVFVKLTPLNKLEGYKWSKKPLRSSPSRLIPKSSWCSRLMSAALHANKDPGGALSHRAPFSEDFRWMRGLLRPSWVRKTILIVLVPSTTIDGLSNPVKRRLVSFCFCPCASVFYHAFVCGIFGRVVVGCVVSCVAFSSSWQWALIYERGARKWMSSWEVVWVINRHITYPIMMSSTFAPASYSVNSKSAANKSLCLENFVHAKRTKLKQSSKRYFRTIKYSLLK